MENTGTHNLGQNISQRLLRIITNETLGAVFLVLIMAIIMTASTDSFFTLRNITNVLRQSSFYIIPAMGALFVVIIGQLDLSVGSTMGFAGIVASIMARDGQNTLLIFVACTCIGLLIGLLNGFLVGYMKLPAFIVTLGMSLAVRGLVTLTTRGNPVNGLTDSFNAVGTAVFFGVPAPIYIMIIICVLAWILLNRTLLGRHVFACGSSVQAAIVSGINAKRTTLIAFAWCGALSGFSGILLTSRMMTGQVTTGTGYELLCIAGIVIGGASVMGGSGTIVGSVFGMLVINIVNNAMTLVSLDAFYQSVVQGVIIILAMMLDVGRQALKRKIQIRSY